MNNSPSPSNLLEILNWNQGFLLYCHLSNENALDWYGVETRNLDQAIFRWNFRIQPHVAIIASLRTIAQRAETRRRLSFVPFCCHTWRHQSRWAALRIHGDGADPKTVYRGASEAFCALQRLAPRMCSILESTATNEWHVWAIANGYRLWADWNALIATVVSDANLDDSRIRYDRFPSPAALLKPRMLGLRAPGAWNPTTDRMAEIHRHNLALFMPLIVRRYEGFIAKGAS